MILGAYAISLNEQSRVEQFVCQTREFDHVTVLDTGSTDQTVHLLRSAGVHVHECTYDPFDFSKARNDCVALMPPCDWCMVWDFNDECEVPQNLKHLISDQHPHSALTVNYLSSEDPDYLEHKIRIHKPHTWQWTKAVHEYLTPTHTCDTQGHVHVNVKKHVHNKHKKHTFYTQICEQAHVTYPHDPHYSWWAITYYRDTQNWLRLQYFCEHYLAHTTAYQVEFRVYAWVYLSECVQLVSWDKAVDMAVHAFSESLMFKHQIPHCVAIAARRLHVMGINITDSRITT